MLYRTTDLPWGSVGAFFLLDILLASTLIFLLCCPQRVPERIERWFPLRGKWLWVALIAVVGTLHLLSGAIVWLPALIHRR